MKSLLKPTFEDVYYFVMSQPDCIPIYEVLFLHPTRNISVAVRFAKYMGLKSVYRQGYRYIADIYSQKKLMEFDAKTQVYFRRLFRCRAETMLHAKRLFRYRKLWPYPPHGTQPTCFRLRPYSKGRFIFSLEFYCLVAFWVLVILLLVNYLLSSSR